jgi:hypothetical protein
MKKFRIKTLKRGRDEWVALLRLDQAVNRMTHRAKEDNNVHLLDMKTLWKGMRSVGSSSSSRR